MRVRASDAIEPAVLETSLGADRWAQVRRASWRRPALEDPALAAAVLHVLARERRAVALASFSFVLLVFAGIFGALAGTGAMAWGLLALGAVGGAWCLVGYLLLSRSERAHLPTADGEALRARLHDASTFDHR